MAMNFKIKTENIGDKKKNLGNSVCDNIQVVEEVRCCVQLKI